MKIFLSTKADRQLRKLPQSLYVVLLERIEKLADVPFPPQSKKLTGRPAWRIRIGDYRILYSVDTYKKEIVVLSVAHRREAYKN